ncbi:MAG: AhpC/TSA family protein [Bacteroidales bacterium]|nr:AhpC/TSA family protein [Bacteroidales bacterium]
MKQIKFVAVILAAAFLCSCGSDKARLSGKIEGANKGDVVVKLLDINKMTVIDTLKLDAEGNYSCSVPVKPGDPEFVYVYYGANKVASLILQKGENVNVVSDSLGNYSVTGSPESELLCESEKAQAEFSAAVALYRSKLDGLNPSSAEALEIGSELYRNYVSYYRKRVLFVMENSKSLSTIPVLYENVGDLPVFSQHVDAIHFRNAYDSLVTVYPLSRYVKALDAEAARRENLLQLNNKASLANEIGFIDLDITGVDGKKISLSSVAENKKVVMVYFWASVMGEQKMFNQDVLKPVYKQFAPKGFEIYAVSLDTDKAAWATAVKAQEAGWVNVCDGLGTASPVISTYNVQKIPSLFFIIDGEVVTSTGVKDDASLRSFLSSKLK